MYVCAAAITPFKISILNPRICRQSIKYLCTCASSCASTCASLISTVKYIPGLYKKSPDLSGDSRHYSIL